MPTYYVSVDERYPDFDLHATKEKWHTETVELTEEEARAFTASQILYQYWQNVVKERAKPK